MCIRIKSGSGAPAFTNNYFAAILTDQTDSVLDHLKQREARVFFILIDRYCNCSACFICPLLIMLSVGFSKHRRIKEAEALPFDSGISAETNRLVILPSAYIKLDTTFDLYDIAD